MDKKYYRYMPINFKNTAYEKGIIEKKDYYHIYSYEYKNKRLFLNLILDDILLGGIDDFYLNYYIKMDFFCYEENGIYFDLITGEQLTIQKQGAPLEEKNIYFDIDMLQPINTDIILEKLKKFPKSEIKGYRKYLNEEIKTKNYLEN